MTIWFASGVPLQRFVRPVLRDELAGAAADRRARRSSSGPGRTSAASLLKDRVRAPLRPLAGRAGPVPDLGRRPAHLLLRGRGERHQPPAATSSSSPRAAASSRSPRPAAAASRSPTTAASSSSTRASATSRTRATARRRCPASRAYRVAGRRARSVDPQRDPAAEGAADDRSCCATPTAANQGELAWRLGLVLAAANMLLLGIGMSASNPRHASNWNLLFALLGFFVVLQLHQPDAGLGRLGPARPRRRAARRPRRRVRARARPALVARARQPAAS